MQNQLSPSFTRTSGVSSDGVSVTSYIALSNQSILPVTEANVSALTPSIQRELTDTGATGGVRFVMTGSIGSQIVDSPEDAMRQMICHYMIWLLDHENLHEAYDSVSKIYERQETSKRGLPPLNPDVRVVPSAHATEQERPAFGSFTGETLTGASHTSLPERMERGQPARLADQLAALGRECAALPDFDTRTPDEIVGYDDTGMWR